MFFRQVLHDDRSCASYVIGCPSLGVAAVVDPQGDPQTYVDLVEANAMMIRDVIDTHVHADHRSAARAVANATGATLHLGTGADVDFAFTELTDGQVLEVGNRRIGVIYTPGHTPEHVSLLVDDWFVLTGDTLFVGDVGRVDLALGEVDEDELRGRAKLLHESLRRLAELRGDVELYPGHYAGSTCGRGMDGKTISTIGRERRTNKALGLDVEEFVAFQMANIPPVPQDFRAIKEANVRPG
ncbi:MAG TPA: MBL fold metallo-hydrolase [Actinomycetota bacterium]|nr:MBL fold metallo-hydrolase [Actinomycetota bacterium]